MNLLAGKVALVTGASRGIGKGIVLGLGEAGATIYITGRTMEEGKAVVPLLSVGTDMFIARELCRRAAVIEPAIVFPDILFTQIFEARHCQGTLAVDAELILRLLDNVCREIARNGLKKIIIVNSHGGNEYLIQFFTQIQLAQQRDYVVYVADPPLLPEDEEIIKDQWQTTIDGHASENETGQILAIRPELVHMDQLPTEPEGMPLEHLKALTQAGVSTGI